MDTNIDYLIGEMKEISIKLEGYDKLINFSQQSLILSWTIFGVVIALIGIGGYLSIKKWVNSRVEKELDVLNAAYSDLNKKLETATQDNNLLKNELLDKIQQLSEKESSDILSLERNIANINLIVSNIKLRAEGENHKIHSGIEEECMYCHNTVEFMQDGRCPKCGRISFCE